MPGSFEVHAASALHQQHAHESREGRRLLQRIAKLEEEMVDLRRAYSIAQDVIGLPPFQQRELGNRHRGLLSRSDLPNARELVSRLITVGECNQS